MPSPMKLISRREIDEAVKRGIKSTDLNEKSTTRLYYELNGEISRHNLGYLVMIGYQVAKQREEVVMASNRSQIDRIEVMVDTLNRKVEKIEARIERIEAALDESSAVYFRKD